MTVLVFNLVCISMLQSLLENKNDQHGRNSTLLTYVAYLATLPHPSDPAPPTLTVLKPPSQSSASAIPQQQPGPTAIYSSASTPAFSPLLTTSVAATSPTHSTLSAHSIGSSGSGGGGAGAGDFTGGSMASVTSSIGSSGASYVGPMISESAIGISAPISGASLLVGGDGRGSAHTLHPLGVGVPLQPSHRR